MPTPPKSISCPLLVALGATGENEAVRVLEGGIDYGVLSMESYAWGVQ